MGVDKYDWLYSIKYYYYYLFFLNILNNFKHCPEYYPEPQKVLTCLDLSFIPFIFRLGLNSMYFIVKINGCCYAVSVLFLFYFYWIKKIYCVLFLLANCFNVYICTTNNTYALWSWFEIKYFAKRIIRLIFKKHIFIIFRKPNKPFSKQRLKSVPYYW